MDKIRMGEIALALVMTGLKKGGGVTIEDDGFSCSDEIEEMIRLSNISNEERLVFLWESAKMIREDFLQKDVKPEGGNPGSVPSSEVVEAPVAEELPPPVEASPESGETEIAPVVDAQDGAKAEEDPSCADTADVAVADEGVPEVAEADIPTTEAVEVLQAPSDTMPPADAPEAVEVPVAEEPTASVEESPPESGETELTPEASQTEAVVEEALPVVDDQASIEDPEAPLVTVDSSDPPKPEEDAHLIGPIQESTG
jgi:hypothetical protein